MIDFDKTKQLFSYDPSQLSIGSNKKIVLNCDYCGIEYSSTPKKRKKSNEYCDKDSCNNCRYKKREDVSMARDGVKNSAQRPEVRNKIKAANQDWINSEKFAAIAKATTLSRYGVENAMYNEGIKQKLKNTLIKKYGVDNIMKRKEVAKEASEKSIKTRIKRGIIKSIDGMTIPEYAKSIGFSRSHFGTLVRKYGVDLALNHQKKISSLEKHITSWLDFIGIEYETQFRVNKKIADIRVNNVLIECDGLYWHSDIFLDDDYHFNKSLDYKNQGYRPLFFRGNEIENKLDIVKSIISNAIGINGEKYYARKLTIKQIDFSVAKVFMQQNHLMGPTQNVSSSIGLFDGDKLISVMQIKRNKNKEYEIARFCNLLNTSVVGGFSKILKYIENTFDTDAISTFIDLRYGTGDYLSSFDFTKISCYRSFSWTNGKETFHRMKFRGNSGYDRGLYKIWDCGQLKYTKTFGLGI